MFVQVMAIYAIHEPLGTHSLGGPLRPGQGQLDMAPVSEMAVMRQSQRINLP